MGFVDPGRNNRSRAVGKRKSSSSSTSNPPILRKRTSSKSSSPASKRPSKRHNTSRSPTPPQLSPFESLPAEILYRVFETSSNLSLTKASLHLTHTFATKHLQLNYVHCHRDDVNSLSEAFTLRFFTVEFLTLWEERFGVILDAGGAWVPTKVMTSPWSEGSIALFEALVERGAGLEPGAVDVYLGFLHSALIAGRADVVGLLVRVGVRPDTESLRLAMKYTVGDEGDLAVCRLLVGHGADVGDVGVWRVALGLGRGVGGEMAVEWLLEGAAPPGEVLGELSWR